VSKDTNKDSVTKLMSSMFLD